jgi:hypothetical protein
VQLEYSPFALDIESTEIGILKICRELGIAVVAYSPLGRDFLTGQLKSPDDFEEGDSRKHAPRYSKENFPENLKLVQTLQDIAEKKGCSVGQLSLAWLLAQGFDIIPIPYVHCCHSVRNTNKPQGKRRRSSIWRGTLALLASSLQIKRPGRYARKLRRSKLLGIDTHQHFSRTHSGTRLKQILENASLDKVYRQVTDYRALIKIGFF